MSTDVARTLVILAFLPALFWLLRLGEVRRRRARGTCPRCGKPLPDGGSCSCEASGTRAA